MTKELDKLDIIFKNQQVLQERLAFKRIKTDGDTQQYINQMILALIEESVEIMRCTAYKNPEYVKFGWKKKQEMDYKEMRKEIVDLMHFVVNLALISGMNSQEFFEIFNKKNSENHKRQDDQY